MRRNAILPRQGEEARMCRVGAEAMRFVGEREAILPHPRHSALLPLAGEDKR